MTITTGGRREGDPESIDVSRLSVRAVVALAATVAVVAWVLSAAAAFFGVQLALSQIRSDRDRDRDRVVTLKESVDEDPKTMKLLELDSRDHDKRITLLEAAEKSANIGRR